MGACALRDVHIFGREVNIQEGKIMTREEYVKSIRETAEEYFRSGTFFCSEAVLQTINDALGKPFSDEIVKMASSFPIGMGKAQCLCGAVSGGEMALGIVYGRVKGQPMDPKMFPMAKGLHDFIKETKLDSVKI